jgi:hypothetical protein
MSVTSKVTSTQYYMQIDWRGLASVLQLTQDKLQVSFRLPLEEAFNSCHLTCNLFIKYFFPYTTTCWQHETTAVEHHFIR